MNELRFNRFTGEWVIVASERAMRKHEKTEDTKVAQEIPEWSAQCPFCPGNENLTPEELFAYADEKGTENSKARWKLRVVPNKYPVVSENNVEVMRPMSTFFQSRCAQGQHYVIIETPYHNRDIPLMTPDEVNALVRAYFDAVKILQENPKIRSIILFRNHGVAAGTSLTHPHSQIVGLSFVPTHIMDLFNVARCYNHEHGTCMYCDTIRYETEAKERVIMENEEFVAFVPFAAKLPYEISIMPKAHISHFINLPEEKRKYLGEILHKTLKALRDALDDPAYNLVLYTTPTYIEEVESYHWYIEITPRLTIPAGFEMGSGVTVNTSQPENDAKNLREKISNYP
jgi:UDPglucose--hexose-1-phosphate uridylyltransferase